MDHQTEVQPCLSAPGLLEHVVETARAYFDRKPEPFPGAYRRAVGNFQSVMPNDNTNMRGCPDCRARYRSGFGPTGNASHYVWGFVHGSKAAFFTTWEYLLKPHITEWAFPCLVLHVHADDVKHPVASAAPEAATRSSST